MLNILTENLTSKLSLSEIKNEIRILSNFLYVEFILKGYDKNEISNFADDILDEIQVLNNEIYYTKFHIN